MPLWVLGSKGGEEGIAAEEAAVFTLFESDQNDWIRTYEGQGLVYPLILEATYEEFKVKY